MIMGNLPETESSEDNNYLILSKDDVHLLKIKLKNLLRGTGAGKGLKFWIEDEHSIKRLITLDNDYSSNDHFLIPGNAELVVALDIEYAGYNIEEYWSDDPEDPLYHILKNKYYGGSYLFNGCYFLRRTSSKDCIGGSLRYKYWDGGDSRLPDTDVADIANVSSHRRHDITLPGWVLLSTDPNAVKYELVYRDATGTETVLDTVDPLEDTITIAELEFHVSGYIDPTIYEPIFIEVYGGSYKETSWLNNQWWPCVTDDFVTIISETHGVTPYPYYINEYLGPNRKQWCNTNTEYSTSMFYPWSSTTKEINNKDIYMYCFTPESQLYTHKLPWTDPDDPATSNFLFYHYKHFLYDQQGQQTSEFEYQSDNWKPDGKTSHYIGEEEYYNLKVNCFDPEKEFAWIGYVVDYTGYSFDSETAARDATHYIIETGEISDLNCFFTGIVDDPKNDVAFYTGKGKGIPDGDIPPESAMDGIIYSDGTFVGSKYMLMDSEGYKRDLVTPKLSEGTEVAEINGVSIYAPSGGGGGGGGNFTRTTLYTAPNTTQTTPITFDTKVDYDEWDELLIYFMNKDANSNFRGIVPLILHNADWFYDYSPLAFNFALPGLTTARYAGVTIFIRSEWGKGNYAGSTLPQYQQRRAIGIAVDAWSGSEAYIKAVYAIKY